MWISVQQAWTSENGAILVSSSRGLLARCFIGSDPWMKGVSIHRRRRLILFTNCSFSVLYCGLFASVTVFTVHIPFLPLWMEASLWDGSLDGTQLQLTHVIYGKPIIKTLIWFFYIGKLDTGCPKNWRSHCKLSSEHAKFIVIGKGKGTPHH